MSFASLFFRPDGRRRVYQHGGKRFADACVDERDRFGGGFIIVWGGIAHRVKSQLIFVEGNMTAGRYKDEISAPLQSLLSATFADFTAGQFPATCSQICRDFLANNNIVPHQIVQISLKISVGRSEQKGKEAIESLYHPLTIKKCFDG